MTAVLHSPATELNLVLPFKGGTVSLTVAEDLVSFTVTASNGAELRRNWITAEEFIAEQSLPSVDEED